jgi:pSer/pThr/pTyr-binding forkhead associated (FHA) protein
VRFGRHPDNDVSFDAHRDLDASSRHAELRPAAGDSGYVLVDVGSSNGTLVDGERRAELPIAAGESAIVEFGSGGPRLRIYVGDPALVPPVPEIADEREPIARATRVLVIGLIIGILVVAAVAWMSLV